MAIAFDNSYGRLPPRFYTRLAPTPVAEPGPLRVNRPLCELLGIDPECLASATGTDIIAGNSVPQGADPIATVYAGHQFGSWNPQLGDGRAILLGEVIGQDQQRYDIQLKGCGPTPYSRGGDGRSPLGPVIREYIVSEAMAALGVPTTRSLAAVTTGERVIRESALPGGVLARVARSHIRIGTFQFFASRQDTEGLRLLADHVISRHYPEAGSAHNPYGALLDAVIAAQAQLVARWQLLGFIHGVMNTDNILLSGETIDYGPCAFMDTFDADTVFSSIDHGGRYAYRNQPGIAHWNLASLAQALLPILADDQEAAVAMAQEAVDAFPQLFQQAHLDGLRSKLGLAGPVEGDEQLITDLLQLMAQEKTDFTLTFRRLGDLACPETAAGGGVLALFEFGDAFAPWLQRWQQCCAQQPAGAAQRQQVMYRHNPVFIPRNHLVQEVIDAAVTAQDYRPFHQLADLLADPFSYRPELARFASPPLPEQVVRQTFCGT